MAVSKGFLTTLKGRKDGALYVLHATVQKGDVSAVEDSSEKMKPWHHRLGHLSEKGMKVLQSQNLIHKYPSISLDFYEDCVVF